MAYPLLLMTCSKFLRQASDRADPTANAEGARGDARGAVGLESRYMEFWRTRESFRNHVHCHLPDLTVS